jgi:uncharacterized protein with HEPN domain
MSDRSQELFLSDIIESIDAIKSFVIGFDIDSFGADRKTYSATIRELEIIGEAIKNISDDIKLQYPDVLWQEIRSFRNKITHEYFGVDVRIVWDIVRNELDLLDNQIHQILASLSAK